MLIQRFLFHAPLGKSSRDEISLPQGLLTAHRFRYLDQQFLYAETEGLAAGTDLERELTSAGWTRLYDIFHYAPDLEVDQWMAGRGTPHPRLRLVKLRPDKVASYVYWHYLLQEGGRDLARQKYGIIGLSGNLLAMYTEDPVVLYNDPYPLTIRNAVIPEDWQGLMEQHFLSLDPQGKSWIEVEGY